jgi:hypothetical protein
MLQCHEKAPQRTSHWYYSFAIKACFFSQKAPAHKGLGPNCAQSAPDPTKDAAQAKETKN